MNAHSKSTWTYTTPDMYSTGYIHPRIDEIRRSQKLPSLDVANVCAEEGISCNTKHTLSYKQAAPKPGGTNVCSSRVR